VHGEGGQALSIDQQAAALILQAWLDAQRLRG
jgi:RNase H-fold protein (predicted Holliday junction resolvase)